MALKEYLYSLINKKYFYHLLFVIIHIGFITLNKKLFSDNNDWASFLPTFLVHLSLMILITYLNGFVLLPWYRKTQNLFFYLLLLALLVGLYIAIKCLYDYSQFAPKLSQINSGSYWRQIWSTFLDAIWFVVVSVMLYVTQTQHEKDQQLKNAQIAHLNSELKYLRAQINPHFLFNGLNTIYGHISKTNSTARGILIQFSDILRYNLYEADADQVLLEKEVHYLENYINMQKARTGEHTKIDFSVEISDNTQMIAPMLFLPFVENAFKFSSRDDDSENNIRITLLQQKNEVCFKCENSYENVRHTRGGIGLENVKRRLQLLYPGAHTLQLVNKDKIWYVQLNLTI